MLNEEDAGSKAGGVSNKNVKIVNEVHNHYYQKGDEVGRNAAQEAISTNDLQAQILAELQQANNLANKTHKNVKKIAEKPNYVTNEELEQLERDVGNGNNGNGLG